MAKSITKKTTAGKYSRGRGTGVLTEEGRAAIAAAQRKRWREFRKAQKAAGVVGGKTAGKKTARAGKKQIDRSV